MQSTAITRRGQSFDTTVVFAVIVTVIAAFFLWETRLLLPIKIFVVFLHELSHGLAAILTGGSVERLILLDDEGGLAFTRGGNRFLILSAGYLGSALWGTLLMRLAWARPVVRRVAIQGIAGLLALALLLYIRDVRTLAYVTVFILGLWAVARWGDSRFHLATLWLLGSFSSLYAILDIGTDVLLQGPFAGIPLLDGGNTFTNDATLLASVTFVPAFVWGLLWGGIAVALYLWNVFSLAVRRGG